MAKGIFNLNNVFRAFSMDRKHSMSMGCFGGGTGISIFKSEKDQNNNGPIGKVFLYEDTLIVMKKLLKSILDKQEQTSMNFSICKFDGDLKQYIPVSKIIIGRDDKLMIYVDMHVENIKEVLRFYLGGPASYLINEESPKDKIRTEIGCEKLIKAIDSCFIGMLLTRETELLNDLAQKRQQNGGTGYSGAPAATQSSKFDDDIPF